MRTTLAITVAALVASSALACAHDHWINHGRYFSPIDGSHCCGDNDCEEIPSERVESHGDGSFTFVRPGLYVTEFVPAREVQWSKDGNYWRCKKSDGSRRCFFAPPPGT